MINVKKNIQSVKKLWVTTIMVRFYGYRSYTDVLIFFYMEQRDTNALGP